MTTLPASTTSTSMALSRLMTDAHEKEHVTEFLRTLGSTFNTIPHRHVRAQCLDETLNIAYASPSTIRNELNEIDALGIDAKGNGDGCLGLIEGPADRLDSLEESLQLVRQSVDKRDFKFPTPYEQLCDSEREFRDYISLLYPSRDILTRDRCGFMRTFERRQTGVTCRLKIDPKMVISLASWHRHISVLGKYMNKAPIMTVNALRYLYTLEAFKLSGNGVTLQQQQFPASCQQQTHTQTTITGSIEDRALEYYLRTDIKWVNELVQQKTCTSAEQRGANFQFSQLLHRLKSTGYPAYIFQLAYDLNLNIDFLINSTTCVRYRRVTTTVNDTAQYTATSTGSATTPSVIVRHPIGVGWLTVLPQKYLLCRLEDITFENRTLYNISPAAAASPCIYGAQWYVHVTKQPLIEEHNSTDNETIWDKSKIYGDLRPFMRYIVESEECQRQQQEFVKPFQEIALRKQLHRKHDEAKEFIESLNVN